MYQHVNLDRSNPDFIRHITPNYKHGSMQQYATQKPTTQGRYIHPLGTLQKLVPDPSFASGIDNSNANGKSNLDVDDQGDPEIKDENDPDVSMEHECDDDSDRSDLSDAL